MLSFSMEVVATTVRHRVTLSEGEQEELLGVTTFPIREALGYRYRLPHRVRGACAFPSAVHVLGEAI